MPQINGITPQIGNLPAQDARSKGQEAGIPEGLMQAARANDVRLQSRS